MNIQTLTQQPYETLDALAEKLEAAKQFEKEAREYRVSLEQEIIDIAGVKTEGSNTIKTDHFAITTTGKVSRKLDQKMFAQLGDVIPQKLLPVKTKVELDITKLRYLENNEPQYYEVMSKCITTTPNKPSVSFKSIEEK